MSKKVFISHSNEDKERFVENFAKKLRENGIGSS
ncbi:MAG: toll/interleukin-1 receptor domain-containing protein partial [Methanobrevibacter sp. CfCl-M3]